MTTRFENIKTDLNELENEGLIKNEALIKIYGMVQEIEDLIEHNDFDMWDLYEILDTLEEEIEKARY